MNVNTYIFIACTRFLELQRYKSVTKIVCNKKITDFYPNLVDKMVCKHWSAVVIKGHKFESPVPSTSMHIYKYRCTYTHTIVCGFSNKCQQIHFYSHIKVYECQWLYWLCGAIKCTHRYAKKVSVRLFIFPKAENPSFRNQLSSSTRYDYDVLYVIWATQSHS